MDCSGKYVISIALVGVECQWYGRGLNLIKNDILDFFLARPQIDICDLTYLDTPLNPRRSSHDAIEKCENNLTCKYL